MTEDLITALAQWRWFPVIARNSAFAYKGRAVDVTQVGRELNARYVLEGSLRLAGDRVRINAQLIDAGNGHHLWAQTYDRRLGDIFDLQDEITRAIVVAIEPQKPPPALKPAGLVPVGNTSTYCALRLEAAAVLPKWLAATTVSAAICWPLACCGTGCAVSANTPARAPPVGKPT